MNILFAANVLPNTNSGASGTEYQTIEALKNYGHNVFALWKNNLNRKILHNNLHNAIELPLLYDKSIANFINHYDVDVFHVNQPYAWLAAKNHRFKKSKTIFINRSHGWEPNVENKLKHWRRKHNFKEWKGIRCLPGMFLKFINTQIYPKLCAKYSDGIIVSSTDDKKYICENYVYDENRVSVIHQAIPNSFFEAPPVHYSKNRHKKILYVGQFAFVKAPQELGKIISKVILSRKDVEFTWCCHKKHHSEALALINKSVYNKITMIDWQDQNKLISLYDTHGIFLFPSFYEGFGKAALEAMSRGMCVISSETGGMKDIIIDGKSGFLIGIGDTNTFINRTLDLLNNYEYAKFISHAAIETAIYYSWHKVAKDTLAFYDKIQSICNR